MKASTYKIVSFIALPFILIGCSETRSDKIPLVPTVSIHGDGWADPSSSNFHGNAIRNQGWDIRSCETCHGEAFNGGTADVSCLTCHTSINGPENCTTCHGGVNNAPPKDVYGNVARSAAGVGAHQIHLLGSVLRSPVDCGECHTVPGDVYQQGHIDTTNGLTPHVVFNEAPASTITNEPGAFDYNASLPLFKPNPIFNSQTLKCSGTYCHGNFKNGNGDSVYVPVWNDTTGTGSKCGTCHGDPTQTGPAAALPKTAARGGTHPNVTTCWTCHSDVVDANLNIIDPTKHINGKLNVFGQERSF
jgi:predicted CxxxxCH...CXXCH cytochrome family protein